MGRWSSGSAAFGDFFRQRTLATANEAGVAPVSYQTLTSWTYVDRSSTSKSRKKSFESSSGPCALPRLHGRGALTTSLAVTGAPKYFGLVSTGSATLSS